MIQFRRNWEIRGALRNPNSALERPFPESILGWTIGAIGVLILRVPQSKTDLKRRPMNKNNGKHHKLPSRELAYGYTLAMYCAQLVEANVRAILKIHDDHCRGKEY